MDTLRITRTIEDEWLDVPPIRVGAIPAGQPTPVAYAVRESGGHRVRVDVYASDPDCYAFEAVIEWNGCLIIGFGSYLHLVGLADGVSTTISLGAYFSRLYPLDSYLLATSAERVFRVNPNRAVQWRSDIVGIDGVVLLPTESAAVVIGEGEWDPPGGWRQFTLSATSGRQL